jgi:hypothetical protein
LCLQPGAKGLERAADALAYDQIRTTEISRDVSVVTLVKDARLKRRTLAARKLLDESDNPVEVLSLCVHALQVLVGQRHGLHAQLAPGPFFHAATTHAVDQDIASDGQEPPRCRVVKRATASMNSHQSTRENLSGEVSGHLTLPRAPQQVRHDHRLVSLEEDSVRGRLACARGAQEFQVASSIACHHHE